ncbi:hypothetical protein LV85_01640 [Algoriphagus chordae]|uniref:Uncharacterized protein n=1 Tax=Algoriphagus chordae TaxID=237019 RepID=A0A2W7SRH8_9BACT|nr:hypothetical protein LV85_01640 [Algoriphagus chordae]
MSRRESSGELRAGYSLGVFVVQTSLYVFKTLPKFIIEQFYAKKYHFLMDLNFHYISFLIIVRICKAVF